MFRSEGQWDPHPSRRSNYDETWFIRIRQEFEWIHGFVDTANRPGLELPTDASDFTFKRHLLKEKAAGEGIEGYFRDYPQTNLYKVIALAQHHRVPTRLLDFTSEPLKALFFAVEPRADDTDFSCIWAVNRSTLPDRYRMLHISSCENQCLYRQGGLFVIDADANADIETRGNVTDMRQVLAQTYASWKAKQPATGYVTHPYHYPALQIDFPTSLRSRALQQLEDLNINRAILMPSYENVVETIRFRKLENIH